MFGQRSASVKHKQTQQTQGKCTNTTMKALFRSINMSGDMSKKFLLV